MFSVTRHQGFVIYQLFTSLNASLCVACACLAGVVRNFEGVVLFSNFIQSICIEFLLFFQERFQWSYLHVVLCCLPQEAIAAGGPLCDFAHQHSLLFTYADNFGGGCYGR